MNKSNYRIFELGYSLIGVMIALVVVSIIMMGLTKLYIGSWQNSRYVNRANIMTTNADLALNRITNDISHSGEYGCYNLRTQYYVAPAVSFNTHGLTGSAAIDPIYAGLRVFSNPNIALAEEPSLGNDGAQLDAAGQVLKIQYGDGFALAIPDASMSSISLTIPSYFLSDGTQLSILSTVNTPDKLDVAASTINSNYVLSSCARLDQFKQLISANSVNVGSLAIPVNTQSKTYHDYPSLGLMNALTEYYYLATVAGVQGLYLNQLQANGSYSGPMLLMANVSNFSFDFVVVDPASGNRSVITPAGMLNSDWAKISIVNLNFGYYSSESRITSNNGAIKITKQVTVALVNHLAL